MMSDELLREAAGEAEAFLLDGLPEIQRHQFSSRFERKMKKLLSRATHPVRYQVMRGAAAVLLVILTLYGAVFAASPEARASAARWVKSTVSGLVGYISAGTASQTRSEYELTFILEGYELYDVVEDTDRIVYLYENDAGHFLKFGYSYPPTGNSISGMVFYTEGYREYSGFVHGVNADIYLADDEDCSNAIAWCDEETGAMLYVDAYADKETLVKLAESVIKKE